MSLSDESRRQSFAATIITDTCPACRGSGLCACCWTVVCPLCQGDGKLSEYAPRAMVLGDIVPDPVLWDWFYSGLRTRSHTLCVPFEWLTATANNA